MRVVDEAIFAAFEEAGMWAEGLHAEDDAPAPEGMFRVMDGLVEVNKSTNIVTYDLPYAVYYSSVGDDPPTPENMRLVGRRGRRSVFFSLTYVGRDRHQAKWAGERLRAAISDRRLAIPNYRTWLVGIEESQRIRRDDDAVDPDGSPLFYGVDNYAVSIVLNHEGVSP